MFIIGHRGAAGHEPENTLRSVAKGMELGAQAVEIDVQEHLGKLLVLHDRTLNRTTNGQGSIDLLSIEAIRSLDAGRGERIPFLEEVLELVAGRVLLNIELKGGEPVVPLLNVVKEWLKSSSCPTSCLLLSSFNHRWLLEARSSMPDLPVAPLVYGVPHDLALCGERVGASIVNVDRKFVTREFVEDATRRRLRVYAYTVNDRDELIRMNSIGVTGIFTDFPDRMLSTLNR